MTAQTATAYAARSTAARKAAEALAAEDRPFTAADEERVARLGKYAQRCYALTYKAAGMSNAGFRITEGIFHDRDEIRFALATIRRARKNG